MPALAVKGRTEELPGEPLGLERLQHWLAIASQCTEWVLIAACGGLLLLLAGNVFLEVMIRYVASIPIPWTEEVARFALVWFGMLAAAASARKGLHFSFRWATMLLKPSVRRVLRFIVNVMVFGFLLLLFYYSYAFLDIVADQTAVASEINMRIPFAGLPVGIAAMLLVYGLEIADGLLSVWTGKTASAKETLDEETSRQLSQPEDVPSLPFPSFE